MTVNKRIREKKSIEKQQTYKNNKLAKLRAFHSSFAQKEQLSLMILLTATVSTVAEATTLRLTCCRNKPSNEEGEIHKRDRQRWTGFILTRI